MKNIVKVTTLLILNGWFFFIYPMISVLAISDFENNQIVAVFRPMQAEFFHVEFIHSVNKTPVREYYQLQSCGLMLLRAEYSSLGAGMPSVPETKGAVLEISEGAMILDQINVCSDSVIYRVGGIARHMLHINGDAWEISDLQPGSSAFVFSSKKISIYKYIITRQKGGGSGV